MKTAIAVPKPSIVQPFRQKSSAFLPFIPIAILFGLVFYKFPLHQTLELDGDEGINLIKALLVNQGFTLYQEIWNDQPPLFTLALANWWKLFGQSLFSSRLLVLCFSSLLVWSFYQILRDRLGERAAFLGSLLLITSVHFIRLSASVMIGLPAISLALSAIYFSSRYCKSNRRWYLLLSACLFALSLHTKLFTVFLIPLVWVETFISKPGSQQNQILRSFLYWLLPLGILYFTIGFLFQSINLDQLLEPHFNSNVRSNTESSQNLLELIAMLKRERGDVVLAILGIKFFWDRKKKTELLPLYWLIATLVVLLVQKPIRYHYILLLTIPLCWLAAYGIEWLIQFFNSPRTSYLRNQLSLKNILKYSVLGFAMVVLLNNKVNEFLVPASFSGYKPELLNLVMDYRDRTNWIFTDRPTYAFNANLPVPPEIAVLSVKRFKADKTLTEQSIEVVQKYRPEQIILSRNNRIAPASSEFRQSLKQDYTQVYEYVCTQPKCTPAAHYILTEILQPETTPISQSDLE